MSQADPQALHDLSSFAAVLRSLQEAGFEFAVIGGAAVSAYARLLETSISTGDLDLYVTPTALDEILNWAPGQHIAVLKRPQPRNVPVALLDANGLEINLLTASSGLPDPDSVIRNARTVVLTECQVETLVADPFDLLRNKLAVRRAKDLPHITFLERFLQEEIVEAFGREREPRARLAPARRYLEVVGRKTLPVELGERLLNLAQNASDFRFLANRLPHRDQVERLATRAANADFDIRRIVERRNFEQGLLLL